MINRKIKSIRELRKFALVMFVPLSLIAGVLWWKGRGLAPFMGLAALFFAISGLFFPSVLRPVEKVWMKFAELIGAVMTRVILTITFFLVLTPIGLLMRLFGNDPLTLKRRDKEASFWLDADHESGSRFEKPF